MPTAKNCIKIASRQYKKRQQVTLFISTNHEEIEKVRSRFNPAQHKLISAHITLCRENEITAMDRVIKNIECLTYDKPFKVEFNQVERFEHGKGILIQGKESNQAFHDLREKILQGIVKLPRLHRPHITLMHPRNSTCTDTIFNEIQQYNLPTELSFDTITLIEQQNDEPWMIIKEFKIFTNTCLLNGVHGTPDLILLQP